MMGAFGSHLIRKSTQVLVGWPNFLRRLQWPAILHLLQPSPDQLVLDLGAGPMQYAMRLARESDARVIAADLNIRAEHANLAMRAGVMPVQANGLALPFSDRTFDRILMSSLLHMVPDPVALLNECRRVLKPDGQLVLSTPNHYQFIPRWLRVLQRLRLSRLLGVPKSHEGLIAQLNHKFQVGGPQGYYSHDQIVTLLERGGFVAQGHVYAPNGCASFLWELAVLGYARFGNAAFHVLFLFYPLGWILEKICKPTEGSEHIVKAYPVNER